MAGVTSYRNVRKRMRYETWWTVHLYIYLAAAITFRHQIDTGTVFLGHPLARAYWISLWLLTAASCSATASACRPCAAWATASGWRASNRSRPA